MNKILVVLLFSAMAIAQAVRIDQPILTNGPNVPSTGGPLPQALFVANATVTLCTHTSSNTIANCLATPITTYTDSTLGTSCPTTAQLVQLPGNTCTSSAGTAANVGFWYSGGQVDYVVASTYGTYGPYTITSGGSFNPLSPGPIGGTTPSTGAFTNLTASGTVEAQSANIVYQDSPATTTTVPTTPNSYAGSVYPANNAFLRLTHNQFALASAAQGGYSGYAPNVSATITAWSCSASSRICAFTASNSYGAGLPVVITGLTSGSAYNGQEFIIVSNPAPSSTGFSAILVDGNLTVTTASATESGTAVSQAIQLRIQQNLDSTGGFHSNQAVCAITSAFPGNSAVTGYFITGNNGLFTSEGYPCSNGPGLSPVYSGGAYIIDGTTHAYDYTHFPNGVGYVIPAGGSVQFAINTSTYLLSTEQMVAVVGDTTGGAYTISSNNNGAGWVTQYTGTSYSSSGPVAMPWHKWLTQGNYELEVTNTASGTVYVYSVGQNNSLAYGVMQFPESRGGLSLPDYLSTSTSVSYPIEAMVAPHLVFFEQKQNGIYNVACQGASTANPTSFTSFPTLWAEYVAKVNTGNPLIDQVYIGSYDIGESASPCVPYMNTVMRQSAINQTPQASYYDGYYQATLAQMEGPQLNWMDPANNPHAQVNQQVSVGDDFVKWIGAGQWSTAWASQPLATSAIVAPRIYIGGNGIGIPAMSNATAPGAGSSLPQMIWHNDAFNTNTYGDFNAGGVVALRFRSSGIYYTVACFNGGNSCPSNTSNWFNQAGMGTTSMYASGLISLGSSLFGSPDTYLTRNSAGELDLGSPSGYGVGGTFGVNTLALGNLSGYRASFNGTFTANRTVAVPDSNGTMGIIPTQNSGYAVCETAAHMLGHCSTVVSSTGTCTCN